MRKAIVAVAVLCVVVGACWLIACKYATPTPAQSDTLQVVRLDPAKMTFADRAAARKAALRPQRFSGGKTE